MKKRNLISLIGGIVMSLAIGVALVGCGKEETTTTVSNLPTEAAVLPTSEYSGNVTCHDPSVYYDKATKKYYAFGTHFSVVSSDDLINWKQVASENAPNTLFGTGNWASVLTASTALAGTAAGSTWAPSVIYLKGKYYMYYSLTTAFGANTSVIARVESDSVTGPYSNDTVIVESVTTTESSHPNCIDPEVFTDKNGTLWMVYGSFSSGIYIKELDATGMPVSDGWGTRIWYKGYSSGVEGPYIFYNEATGYYYLMVSEGDLNSNYNMRVARSENPDGPYVDLSGEEVTGSSVAGVKIAGNYKFNGGSNKVALGHNSVIEVDDTYYVVCHVRNAVSGSHHLEVHQLYFNEDGWPVMNPNRYSGEVRGLITMEEAAGTYDVVVHSTETVDTIVASVQYTFAADGSITDESGASAGTWSVTDDYYVTIKLNNVEYKGVLAPAWRDYGETKGIYCMTAINSTGYTPLWANAAD